MDLERQLETLEIDEGCCMSRVCFEKWAWMHVIVHKIGSSPQSAVVRDSALLGKSSMCLGLKLDHLQAKTDPMTCRTLGLLVSLFDPTTLP